MNYFMNYLLHVHILRLKTFKTILMPNKRLNMGGGGEKFVSYELHVFFFINFHFFCCGVKKI